MDVVVVDGVSKEYLCGEVLEAMYSREPDGPGVIFKEWSHEDGTAPEEWPPTSSKLYFNGYITDSDGDRMDIIMLQPGQDPSAVARDIRKALRGVPPET
jgi:hypothetical protein